MYSPWFVPIGRLEVAELEVNDNETVEPAVVEEQIKAEVILVDLDVAFCHNWLAF